MSTLYKQRNLLVFNVYQTITGDYIEKKSSYSSFRSKNPCNIFKFPKKPNFNIFIKYGFFLKKSVFRLTLSKQRIYQFSMSTKERQETKYQFLVSLIKNNTYIQKTIFLFIFSFNNNFHTTHTYQNTQNSQNSISKTFNSLINPKKIISKTQNIQSLSLVYI